MKHFLATVLLLTPFAANAACVPTSATVGMIGCEPVTTAIASTDYLQAWLPGVFPQSAQIITKANLFNAVTFSGVTTFTGAVAMTAAGTALTVTNNATIGGTLTAAALVVTNNASVGGALGVAGNSTLSGTLAVTGNSTFAGATSIAGNLTLQGRLTFSAPVSGTPVNYACFTAGGQLISVPGPC